MKANGYVFLLCVVGMFIMVSCDNAPHTIFKKDIAYNELTDGNIVFVQPESCTYYSLEYASDHYSIRIRHNEADTITDVVVYSDILEWYQGADSSGRIDKFKKRKLQGCKIIKEENKTSEKNGAKIYSYNAVVDEKGKQLWIGVTLLYCKRERKLCTIESQCEANDNIVNDIIKTIRYR